jgi:hypothetical protein
MTATNIALTKNGTTITLLVTGETENLTKNLILINPPTTTSKQTSSDSYNMRIIDILNKVEWRLSIDCLIDSITSGDSAEAIRTKLRTMFLSGGPITISSFGSGGVFEGRDCNMDKLEIKRIPNDANSEEGLAEFDVKLSLVMAKIV